MYGGDELCLTRSPFPEVVLKVAQNLVTFQKFLEMTMYYMFQRRCNIRISVISVADDKQPCSCPLS